MKKITLKIAFIAVVLFFHSSIKSQTFEWAKSFGGSDFDIGYSITVDASGNVYTTGYFVGTVDFDPGVGTTNLTSNGSSDVFVQKMDPSGNLLWAKSFGGTSGERGLSITLDQSGNIYTTGNFGGTVDFDPGAGTTNLTSNGSSDVFVQKLDPSGNLIWAKSFGGTSGERGLSITSDASGNVYTTGNFLGTVDFDPGVGTTNLTSNGSSDFFIQKLDPSGNLLWAKSFGGTSSNHFISITVDALGNVYTTGEFYGTVDFDPGAGSLYLTPNGEVDVFVQKLDPSGNLLWAKSFGGAYYDYGYSNAVDALGNVYTTGYFVGTVDFDPGVGTTNLTSNGFNDVFVQKMDPSGNLLWAKSFGGTNEDSGSSITVDASGNVYTTGYFQESVDFDPGAGTIYLTSNGEVDVFVQKMDPSGNLIWVKSFGGTTSDVGFSIILDASENVYTTGYFKETVDFDPGAGTTNLASNGGYDVFVQKMSPCALSTGTDTRTECNSYTWIDGNTYTSSNNTASYNVVGGAANGCDSLVTLDLTIINSATGTDTRTECNSYTWIDGNTYTSSNNSATFTIVGGAANGCDSMVTLDLTINNVSDLTTSVSGLTITSNNANATYQWIDCDNGNSAINGEIGQSFTVTTYGNYAVELTENGCIDTSDCVAITPVGIIENSFGNKLIVYPNPTSGNFAIDLGAIYENSQVLITDISGKLIESITNAQSQVLNLSIKEPTGIYFVSIHAGSNKAVIRLIKE